MQLVGVAQIGPRFVDDGRDGLGIEAAHIVGQLGGQAAPQRHRAGTALFERGVQLSRFCHARLEEAERRIEILNERGELKAAPASLTADEGER